MLHGSTFYEIAAILGMAVLLGAVGLKLRQPLIIMFLAAGILAGPAGFGVIASHAQVDLLAHMGIALLLFIVGLKLDLNLIRTTGPVALATGVGQIVFTSAIGFLIALAFDMPMLSAAYVAVALTFSSTIIIVKLLSDKKEIDSLHGQIAVGFLIVQDIAAILALVGLTTFGSRRGAEDTALMTTLLIAAKGFGLLAATGLLMRFVIPPLLRRLAQSQELLTLFAVAWAVALGTISDMAGFSKEVGAFLAGISLASTSYRDAIGARLTGLRDFLLLFFFIDLGARLDWTTVGGELWAAFVFSIFVLVGNPLIVLVIMGAMGYRRRTSFLAGLTVAQISEFSLIVAALGLSLGHITPEVMGLITLVGVVTIFMSTYMILYSGELYRAFAGPLKIFERKTPYRELAAADQDTGRAVDVVLVGLSNYGSGVAQHLLRRKMTIFGVDFDPVALRRWRSLGVPVIYGDVGDPELHEYLPLQSARWVVSTVRSRELNLALFALLRSRGYTGKIALTATTEQEAEDFERAGAHAVLRPFADAAEQAADALTQGIDQLPVNRDWAVAFREVRVQSGSLSAGQTIRNIPLRATTGFSIVAVSRAGRIHHDPGPDFQIYPGDRLVIMGPPDRCEEAETLLNQPLDLEAYGGGERLVLGEVEVCAGSARAGKTLADLHFRQRYQATVVGILRGNARVLAPRPGDSVEAGDRLLVIGTIRAVEALQSEPF
ncbi:MAG: cation:proton antiporter [Bryobacterales bacterium]|nr:cation:proton antiporter [Bryobacterales bacterium]